MLGKFSKKTVLNVSGATLLALASLFIVFYATPVNAQAPDWQYYSLSETHVGGYAINGGNEAEIGIDCSLISNLSAFRMRFSIGNAAKVVDIYIGSTKVVANYSTTTTGYAFHYFTFSDTECGNIIIDDVSGPGGITVSFQTSYLSNPVYLSYEYNSGNSQDPAVRQPIMGIYAEGPPPPPPPPPPPIEQLLASSTIVFPLVTNFELASVTAFADDQMYMLFFGILSILMPMMNWFLALFIVASIFVLIYSGFKWLRILK